MRLATEALRERYAARIAHLRLASALLGATFVAWHVLVTVPFLVASFAGTGEWASVTEASTYVTHSKHGSTTHYRLAVRDSEGLTLTQDVPYETFSRVREVRGRAGSAVVPVVRTGSARASYVGSEPFVQVAWIVMGFVAALVGAGVVAGKHGAKVAWYDRKRLVEHGGTGYWQETRPRMPVDPSAS
jgi:lipocalin